MSNNTSQPTDALKDEGTTQNNGMLNLEHSPLHKRIAELEEKYAKLLEATGCELEEFTSVIKN